MPLHAEEEIAADGLTIYDVESVVLTGQIAERQKDRTPGEWKYVVSGRSINDDRIVVVVKVGPTGKLIFITVFRE
jgi:hypothetical protein